MWEELPPILRPSLGAAAGFGYLSASGLCLGVTLSGALSSVRSAARGVEDRTTSRTLHSAIRALVVHPDQEHAGQGRVGVGPNRLENGEGGGDPIHCRAAAQAGPQRDH